MVNRARLNNKPIGEILIQRGIINQDQLDTVLKTQKKNKHGTLTGDLMVSSGLAKEEDIILAIKYQYSVPYLPVNEYEIDLEIIESIPKELAEKYCLIPLDKIEDNLTLAMANPLDRKAIQAIMTFTGCNIQAFISAPSEIKQVIQRYYGDNARLS